MTNLAAIETIMSMTILVEVVACKVTLQYHGGGIILDHIIEVH